MKVGKKNLSLRGFIPFRRCEERSDEAIFCDTGQRLLRCTRNDSYKLRSLASLGLLVACILLFAGLCKAVDLETSADTQTESRDIYDAINVLVDSLRAWSEDHTDVALDDRQTALSLDSLSLTELFPECKINVDDSTGLTTISLPRYLDLLMTSLQLDKSSIETSDNRPEWTAPVIYDGENIFVDSIPIPLSGQFTPDSIIMNHIRERITLLRTIGLPAHLRFQYPNQDSSQVIVTVRGREMIDITFTLSSWLVSLSKIAAGMQVYSGLLNVTIDSSGAAINYYMLITYPGIEGHHFLEWREKLTKTDNRWRKKEVNVMFSPYIRTDNLKDLFAKPRGSGKVGK